MLMGGGAVVDAQINPYTDVGTQKEIVAESVIPSAKATRILADTTKPKVTLEKFGGEIALGVSYDKIKAQGSRPLFSKNMEWEQGDEMMEMVPIDATTTMEDGGMEINIHLAAKPASNVFTFQLENWQNLDFFYQPELTPEEIAEGAYRPENVIGSYAVYYKDHANHVLGQTNYATGKAYHIFRPKVYDDNGAEVWAQMSYAGGMLSVTVPQEFLDTANYPVVVDPTFGYTSNGASSSGNNNFLSGTQFALPDNGTITKFSAEVHVQSVNADGLTQARAGIYLSSSNARIASTSEVSTISTTDAFSDFTPDAGISLTADTYWLLILGSSDIDQIGFGYDTDASVVGSRVAATYPNFPTTYSPSADNDRKYSIYATYTATPATSASTTINGATLQGATIY